MLISELSGIDMHIFLALSRARLDVSWFYFKLSLSSPGLSFVFINVHNFGSIVFLAEI